MCRTNGRYDQSAYIINCLMDMGLYQAQCAAFYLEFELGKRILKARDGYKAKKLAKPIELSKMGEKKS